MNEAVLHTVSSIARARISLSGCSLRQRPLLITHLINTIKPDGIPIHILASVFQALRDLVYPFLPVYTYAFIYSIVNAVFIYNIDFNLCLLANFDLRCHRSTIRYFFQI